MGMRRAGSSRSSENDTSAPLLGGTPRPLTLLPLVALVFYEVCGGPFGAEEAVKYGGPMLTLLGFLILPLIWSVPEALVCAELGTAFPENSGYVVWVSAAFGPFWGLQEGIWSWLSGVADNAVYPVLLASNLAVLVPQLDQWSYRAGFVIGCTLFLTYLNYLGLEVVGSMAVGMALLIMLPFAVLVGLGARHVEPHRWAVYDPDSVQWLDFVNVMFWNLSYWDSVSTLAGEVRNPAKTFPRALLLGMIAVVLSYLLPIMVGLGVSPPDSAWENGYWVQLASQQGGRWLGVGIAVAAAVSQIGQFMAEMSSDSYQVHGMAERGFLPRVLARKSRHGTPTLGILFSAVGILLLSTFNFNEIVELLNVVYCVAELLEFSAFVWLRIKAPHLHRPYRVPLPVWALVMMLTPASVLLLGLIAAPFYVGHWRVITALLGVVALSAAAYPLLRTARARGWCEFNDIMQPIDESHLETDSDRQGLLFDHVPCPDLDAALAAESGVSLVAEGPH